MGHLKEEFRFGMLMWDRGHQISLSKTMGTGNNENKSNSWAQVTSLVFFTELGNQQDNVVTMAPRPRVLHPALHKWGLVRVSTHWDQTGRLWWWWGGAEFSGEFWGPTGESWSWQAGRAGCQPGIRRSFLPVGKFLEL